MIRRSRLMLLVVALTAVMAAAFGSSSAMAEGVCTGENIEGEGSSLQKIAQKEVWDTGFNTNIEGCKVKTPKVTYTSVGSGAGLKAWGVENAVKAHASGMSFIGTDDAPNAAQLKEIDKAANNEGVASVVVTPVAQAAITVLVHYPTGCKLKENKISNSDLQKVWSGEFTEWKQIGGSEGCGENKIKRVVREDKSGTTYQFKHYLAEILKNMKVEKPCAAAKTWEAYQALAENTNWPECGTIAVEKVGAGGGGEAAKVAEKEGSIGYANLSDAKAQYKTEGETHHLGWLQIENVNNKEEAKFFYPGNTAGEPNGTDERSNCAGTNYGLSGKEAEFEKLDADWSGIYGGHPGGLGHLINTNYSICTLTWDLALNDYKKAEYTAGQEQTAADFLKYVVATEGGQKEIRTSKKDYEELQTTNGNVRKVAQAVVLKIAF